MEGGEVVGYGVRLRVGGLERGTDYVFSVAAESVIGVGDYSDPSDAYALEDGMCTSTLYGRQSRSCMNTFHLSNPSLYSQRWSCI